MEVAVFTDSAHPPAAGKSGSGQLEVVLDPNELESNFSDVLLQVVATEQGITTLNVDSVQRGGVALGALTSALAAGWQGVQGQHANMKPCIHQVGVDTHTQCCCCKSLVHVRSGDPLCSSCSQQCSPSANRKAV